MTVLQLQAYVYVKVIIGQLPAMSISHSISDLASELGVTTRTIRFYEEQGMLAPERRGQERIYSARDRVTLMLILRGKRIGLSLIHISEPTRPY